MRWPEAGVPNLIRQATAAGVSTSRLIVAPPYPEATHVLMKASADLALDTPVYGAHTTMSDLLWGGVPCLSLPLEHMATRIGASLIQNIGGGNAIGQSGVSGLVLATHKEYEDAMAGLAH